MLNKHFISKAKRPKMPIWPIVFTMEAFTSKPMERIFGDKCNKVLMTIKDGTCEYFLYEEDINKLSQLLLKKIEKNSQTTKDYINMLLLRGNNLLLFAKSVHSITHDKEILRCLKRYDALYKKLVVLGWPLAIIGEYILTKEIKNYIAGKIKNYKEREKIFEIVSTPSFISYTTKEKIALLKLSLKYKTLKNTKKSLEKHARKYQWIYFDYIGPSLTLSCFSERLKKLIFKKNKKALIGELNEIIKKPQKVKTEIKSVIKKYNFEKPIIEKINALQDLIYIRDKRKEFFTEVHFNMEILLNKISEGTKIDKKYLRWLTTKEFIVMIEGGKIDLQKIKERIKYSAVLSKNGSTDILLALKAKKYFDLVKPKLKNIKLITGTRGCSGKVKGKICIIPKIDDGHKLKKGEILVTTMTTVDFVPIIRKAGAIITDEGGITCHAAIVSRELGIPCIIGTKIATKVLKDGDLVEVDAEKGIVKIIKKVKKG